MIDQNRSRTLFNFLVYNILWQEYKITHSSPSLLIVIFNPNE